MLLRYRYRICPTPVQQQALARAFGQAEATWCQVSRTSVRPPWRRCPFSDRLG
ncbi:helix-turn-helix domain-containing protein [Micromonospora sp. NPDC005299]|uniref:helix-turn-helix domain-containing protein n=1 Tax=Micromonospora sp. NPDC005299 TaxID=3364231 RepID=UPI0036900236